MTRAELKSELEAKFYKVLFVKQAEESDAGYLLRLKEGILMKEFENVFLIQ